METLSSVSGLIVVMQQKWVQLLVQLESCVQDGQASSLDISTYLSQAVWMHL